jgi:outer membrane protein assembly factor BamA
VGGPGKDAALVWYLAMRWLAVIVFLWATFSWAQLAIQGPQPTYDGQSVSAVDLIANPHRDIEPWQPLVLQKAGEPYSQAKVEKSIAALRRQFPEVRVSIIPEITGLRLNFLLEPAYYIGFISFPGAERFSYTRLLQAVDLDDQEPFDRQRLPLAQQSLEKFLNHNGYFEADVSTISEIDDPHQIVNLKFLVKLGPVARIGAVAFEGVDPAEDTRLTRSVHSLRARFTGGLLKSGKPYTP